MFRPKKRHIELGTIFAALVALGDGRPRRRPGLPGDPGARRRHRRLRRRRASPPSTPPRSRSCSSSSPTDEAAEATLTVDGERGRGARRPGCRAWCGARRHRSPRASTTIEVAVPRAVFGDSVHTWRFTVDGTAPALTVPPVVDPVGIGDPARIAGTVEADAELTADGDAVDVDDDGAFTLRFDRPPAGPVTLEATDRAGNTTTASVVVPVTYPGIRGVHVTAAAWSDERCAPASSPCSTRAASTRSCSTSRTRTASSATTPRCPGPSRSARRSALRPRGGGGRDREPRRPRRRAHLGVPGPGPRPGGVGGGPGRPGGPGRRRRALRRRRRVHQPGRPRGAPLQPRPGHRGREPRRRRHPVGRHPPAHRRARHDRRARPGGVAVRRGGRRSWPSRTASCAAAAPTRAWPPWARPPDKGDPLGQDVGRIARNADYVAPEVYPGYWGQRPSRRRRPAPPAGRVHRGRC